MQLLDLSSLSPKDTHAFPFWRKAFQLHPVHLFLHNNVWPQEPHAHSHSHIRTHSGEKPFKCDQCDYSCAVSGHLIRHKRTHTGEQPYTCNQCSFSSKQSSNLQQHRLRKHRQEVNVWRTNKRDILKFLWCFVPKLYPFFQTSALLSCNGFISFRYMYVIAPN